MYTMQASTTLTDRRMARALVGAFFCLALLGAAFLTAAPALAADQQAAPVPDEGKVLERIQQIGMKIKAPCHPDKLVAQHESPEVIQIKKEIRRMLLEGKSEREILDAMAAKYGEAILVEQSLSGWGLWGIVGGAAAVLGIFILIGRWMMAHERAPAALHVAAESEEEKPGTKVA